MRNLVKNIEVINKPIVHIASGFFLSSLCYGIWDYSIVLAIIITFMYYIFLYKYTNKIFLVVIVMFQVIGFGFNYIYFDYQVDLNRGIRVVECGKYNTIGEMSGRRIVLSGNIKGVSVGEEIIVRGEYINNDDKQKGVLGEVEVKNYEKLPRDLVGYLGEVRVNVREKLIENLGQRRTGLITSIAYGDKTLLDEEDNNDMKILGVVHAISVSGMHVALVFFLIKIFLGKGISIGITSLYVIFTGGEFSSIRALIMLMVLVYAIPFKKKYSGIGALSLSAILLIMWRPYTVFDIGFLLSYSATLGIVLFNGNISKRLYRLPKIIREGVAISISAQIFSMPLLIMVFKDISLNFFVGNIILVPIINLIVILGNILPLALNFQAVFDFISYILMITIKVLDWFSELIYSLSIPMIDGSYYWGRFYIFLLIIYYFYKRGFNKMIYLPLVYIIIIGVEMYSPFITIEYFRQGALAINYRGEGAIITNKRNIDIGKIKGETKIDNALIQGKSYKINDELEIKSKEKDFVLVKNEEEQLGLKLDRNSKNKWSYDIIDFDNTKINKIIIIGDKVIKLY